MTSVTMTMRGRLGGLGMVLVLAACGSSGKAGDAAANEAKGGARNGGERKADAAIAVDVGDAPLTNGQPSLAALGTAVVAALNASDGKALWALSATETEYQARLFGALVSDAKARRLGPQLAWTNQVAGSREAVTKALAQHGGKGYAFVSLESSRKEDRGGLVVHRDPTLTVKDAAGTTLEPKLLGVVLEHPASRTFVVLTFSD